MLIKPKHADALWWLCRQDQPGPEWRRPANMRDKGTVSRRAVLVTAGGLIFASAGLKTVHGDTPALASVAQLVTALDGLSAQGHLSDAQLAAGFDALALRHFNVQTMARDTLGTAIEAMPEALWPSFVSAYRRHLQIAFVAGVRRYGASESEVLGSRAAPNGVPVVVTRTILEGRARDTVWFMCRRDFARVCDIEVSGVRASARQKSDFRPVLIREGPEAFLARLAAGQFVKDGNLQP